MLRVYCQRVLSFGPGQRGVVANGRVLGPLNDDETLDLEDFVLLERHSMSSYGDKILKALKKLNDEDDNGRFIIILIGHYLFNLLLVFTN